MKALKRKLLIPSLILLVSMAACKKFGDINVDPTQPNPNELKTRYLLSSVEQGIAGVVFSINSGNHYVQYLSEGPYPGASLYTGKNFNWNGFYTGGLYDLEQIIKYVDAQDPVADEGNGSYANQKAVANILKSFFMIHMTDRWGAIPYSEALKGGDNLSPKYDSQEDVYNDVFTVLAGAVSSIDEAATGVAGDLLLGGDMLLWKKFANTLRMKMALTISKVNPTKGATEFTAAMNASGGVLASNSDNIEWNYIDDPSYYNPWYNNYTIGNRNDYAISKTLTDYMQPKSDPRLGVYAENLGTTASPVYKGLPYGSAAAVNIPNAYSRIGDAFRDKTSPARIFNYPQVLFMMAEAAKIGYIAGGDAQAAIYYQQAIQASFEMNGVYDAPGFGAYYAQVVYSPATGLQQIINEKWVHNYLNGYEAWNDWRRTGFPVLAPAVDAVDTRGIPLRQGYPVNEGSLNEDNYKAAVAAQGTDDNYTALWWDK